MALLWPFIAYCLVALFHAGPSDGAALSLSLPPHPFHVLNWNWQTGAQRGRTKGGPSGPASCGAWCSWEAT